MEELMPADEQATNDPPVKTADDGHADPSAVLADRPADPTDIVAEATRPWRPARALTRLKEQINAAFPGRDKSSDGTVGDASHQSRASDHNPWIMDGAHGVVSAMDITHDPASGCDAAKLVNALHASRDERIKYLIWNRRIANSSPIGDIAAWTWRSYTGRNAHDHHFHLSVKPTKAQYDDVRDWSIENIAEAAAPAAMGDELILSALSALGQSIDMDAPALPQLVEFQEALTQLFANDAQAWPRAEADGVAEATRPGFEQLKPKYEALFASAEVRDQWRGTVAWYLKILRKGRAQYERVEAKTGAPWWFVGIVHAMEASFSFTGHLHNGDPLARRTVQVPKNRPPAWNPPSDWISSAIDAIAYDGHVGSSRVDLQACKLEYSIVSPK